VDVRAVALQWNGGGHKNAAGLTVNGERLATQQAVIAAIAHALPT
jgi:nanoRNase/pAp phosphatase (c-di-AMP/oligoRNAs hydrolase)